MKYMPDKINKLIVNSPHEATQKHWQYDCEQRQSNLSAGRRDAGCVVATPNAKGFDDFGQLHERRAIKIIDKRDIESLRIIPLYK